MLISQILGNLQHIDKQKYKLDFVEIEWYNTQKRIARYTSQNGQEIAMRFDQPLKEGLNHGDILLQEQNQIIAVSIIPTDILYISTKDITEIARICYEIGNYHIPLFFGNNHYEFKTPFEAPLQKLLDRLNIKNSREYGILDSKERLKVHLPIVEPKLKIAQDFQITIT